MKENSADPRPILLAFLMPALLAPGPGSVERGPFGVTPGSVLHAQEVVGDSVDCGACTLGTRTVARLGDVEGPGAIPGAPVSVVVDSRERYWLLFPGTPPMVFDAGGAFLRSVGRMGEGPGEHQYPFAAAAVNDSVVVYDLAAGRLTVFAADFSVVRTVGMSDPHYVQDIVPLDWPEGALMSGRGRGTRSIGWPLHRVDLSETRASVDRSFGTGDGTATGTELEQINRSWRHLVPDGQAGAWAVNRFLRYRVIRWDAEERPRVQLVREATWFPDGSTGGKGGPDAAPSPSIAGLQQDDSGLLWIAGHVASPDWREVWEGYDLSDPAARLPGGMPDRPELYQTMIEVLDPMSRRVVWRGTLPAYTVRVLPGVRLAVYRQDPQGTPSVEVLALTLDEDR